MKYYTNKENQIVEVCFEKQIILGNPSVRNRDGWIYPQIEVDDLSKVLFYRIYDGEIDDRCIYLPDIKPVSESISYSGDIWDLAKYLKLVGHLSRYRFSKAQYVCPVCGHILHHLNDDVLDCSTCGARVNPISQRVFMMISNASCQSSANKLGISLKGFERLIQPYL